MYKLIFIDLDGTLLNDAKEISEENIKWLNRAYKEKGITTIITTGRQYGFVEDLYKKYNCSFGDYVIASNGAIIKNVSTGEYLNKEIIDVETMKKLRDIYLNEELDGFMIYVEDMAYMERKGMKTQRSKESKVYVENVVEILKENKNIETTLCIMIGKKENLNKSIKKIEEIKTLDCTSVCEYVRVRDGVEIRENYFDIMIKDCNKKNAIKKVMDKFGVNHDEIIVIGDGGNDLPMFDYAKLKIAMENGSEALKQKADYITDTNNNDGVAKAIKKFIFEE